MKDEDARLARQLRFRRPEARVTLSQQRAVLLQAADPMSRLVAEDA